METLRRPHRALLTLFALSGTLLFVLVAGQLALQAAVTPRACAEIGGTPSFKATGGFTCNYADGSAQHCYFGGFCTDVAAPVPVAPGSSRERPTVEPAPAPAPLPPPERPAPPRPDRLKSRTRISALYFTAGERCVPCTRMAPDVQTVIDDNPYFSVQKINIDSPSAQAKMERYGVESAPTLVFVFYSQVIGRLDGLQDRAALQTMVDTLVDREIRPKS